MVNDLISKILWQATILLRKLYDFNDNYFKATIFMVNFSDIDYYSNNGFYGNNTKNIC